MSIAERQMNEAIEDTIRAMRKFATAYKHENGELVGLDAIIGGEGVQLVLQGLRQMLNATENIPTDRAELSAEISALATTAGFNEGWQTE